MLETAEIGRVIGRDVYDPDGDKIGSAGQIYVDDHTGQPEWVTVRTGLFGLRESFVPLADAALTDDGLSVRYGKDFVKDAPNVDDEGRLSQEEEDRLYAYYARSTTDDTEVAGDRRASEGDATPTAGRGDDESANYRAGDNDRAGADDASGRDDDSMTVSEERLHVGTERRPAGRARLRKYVVTENVIQTVPVKHEEVRLEREPITDANADEAVSGQEISEQEHDVVLHEERPVVEKETVPVERVRLDTETVTDQETVTGDVRKERVDVDGDSPDAAPRS